MEESVRSTLPQAASRVQASDPEILDALAARAGKGDRRAFEDIYNRTVDEIFGYIQGRCGPDVAEDVTAMTFFKAWRAAPAYKAGKRRFLPWLYAIARNEVNAYWRSQKRIVEPLDSDVIDDTGEDAMHSQELRSVLVRALADLTSDQRDVLILRYYGDKSHAEIGKILGKREGAVRALHLRALRQMRKEMGHAAS